jgi:hypothetical protein
MTRGAMTSTRSGRGSTLARRPQRRGTLEEQTLAGEDTEYGEELIQAKLKTVRALAAGASAARVVYFSSISVLCTRL